MIESILNSIKAMHGIDVSDTTFDNELIMFTNGALMIMTQLGVGPSTGFRITSATETWSDFLDDRINVDLVFSAVYNRVRLKFDPPQNAFLVTAIKEQIQEDEWRLSVQPIPGV